MIVTLDQRLFKPGMPALVQCLHFVLTANVRDHVLLTDPLWDADDETHPLRPWMSSLPREVRGSVEEELERGLDKATVSAANNAKLRVEPLPKSRWEDGVLTPEDALRAMYTPLWLALENGRNDLEFLRRILEPKDRRELDKHIAEGRIEIPLGGGTGELEEFLKRLKAPDEPTTWIRRIRSFCMFDRDADASDPRLPSKTSERIRGHVIGMQKPWPFPGHQLGRRTIENYLPFEALDSWAEGAKQVDRATRRARVAAFKSADFGPQRRALFNMKDGLQKDAAPAAREELALRKRLQYKLKRQPFQVLPPKAPTKLRDIARSTKRWLKETELPVVFQGIQNADARNHLNEGFGDAIAELYRLSSGVDDVWFHRVFDQDPAANAWRKQLVESLWSAL